MRLQKAHTKTTYSLLPLCKERKKQHHKGDQKRAYKGQLFHGPSSAYNHGPSSAYHGKPKKDHIGLFFRPCMEEALFDHYKEKKGEVTSVIPLTKNEPSKEADRVKQDQVNFIVQFV